MKRFKNILLVTKPQCEQPFELKAALTLAEQNSAEITMLVVLPALSAFHLMKKRAIPAGDRNRLYPASFKQITGLGWPVSATRGNSLQSRHRH